jgi:hypothetical protein
MEEGHSVKANKKDGGIAIQKGGRVIKFDIIEWKRQKEYCGVIHQEKGAQK